MITKLYQSLLSLTERNEAFYFKDYILPDDSNSKYRVFNYRLASYTDFLEDNALEARGITFLLDEKDALVSIVCRPWKKFFNLEENPFTMGLDLSKDNVSNISIKADGSLMSTFYNPLTGYFGVKSKQDFFSEQSSMATAFLNNPKNAAFKAELLDLAETNHTVIMELVSPYNRIVLPYQATELIVLGIRHTLTGEIPIYPPNPIAYPELCKRLVETVEIPSEPKLFLEQVEGFTGIEGYVVTLTSGLMFKQKTDWYKALHHLKDSVSSSRRLFEAIILETVDDVKSMFPGDEAQLRRISDMEAKVIPKFNHLIKIVEDFYKANKGLDRKSFAIKGQEELGLLFNLAMMLYLGKQHSSSYKDFAIKYRKEYFDISEISYLTGD